MSLRIMLDSNAHDEVIAVPGLVEDLRYLIDKGLLDIVTTHVQIDELSGTTDPVKRQALLSVPGRKVPTTEAVIGVSRLGEARLGTGTMGGLNYTEIQRGNVRHSEDALIALAAAGEADVLVTQEKRLAKKACAAGTLQVWDFPTFLAHVRGLKAQHPPSP